MKTISEHVLDIVQNSVRAKATLIEVIVDEDKKNDLYALIIKDNGCGMSSEIVEQATNPFFTSRKTRKVGLGLALLKQNAENAGGSFFIISETGKGTEVKAVFQHSNIDRPPLGDIWNTWYYSVLSAPEIRFVYRHVSNQGKLEMDSEEIKEMLEGVPFQKKEIKEAVIELIINNLKEIEVI